MSVVKLSEVAAAERGSLKPEATGILAECRDIVLERLCASMTGALQRVEADLLKKLESTAMSAEDQRLFGEAQRQLNLIKADLDKRFRAVFQRSFNLKAARSPERKDVYDPMSHGALELSLVDQDALAEDIAVKNVAHQMRNRCDSELSELGPRLAYLMGRQEISSEQDPFGPDAICDVLKELCWQLESTKPVKLIILDRLGGSLSDEVVKLYKEVNEHLVKRQVMPRIRHSVKRGSGDGSPVARARAADASERADQYGVISESDLLAGLQQVLSNRGAVQSAGGGGKSTALSAAELVDVLTRVQHGNADPAAGIDAVVVADEGGLHNILRALKDSPLGGQVAPFDALMIDIVATMFDYIFEDPRVPGLMKGLIGRLQIPVLKVAIADRAFFSTKAHPARRFMNLLAAAGTEWAEDLTIESALYARAETLIQRLQDEFEQDVGVIGAIVAEFESFLGEEQRVADRKAAELAGELEERERREIAQTVAQAAVEPYVADQALPAPVRNFLETSWIPVLIEAHRQGGEEGAPWNGAVATMDDLVWSVQPKFGAEARKLLVQRLPILLKQMRVGLDAVGTPAEDRERFFSQLVGLHAAAVKAGMTAAAPPASLARSVPPAASHAVPHAAANQAAVRAVEKKDPLDVLTRGSWVEIGEGYDEPLRARLTWISPARTMYLFTNRQGQRALALTRKELTEKFETGAVRLTDDTPLIDRVVESVLEGIQVEDSTTL